MPRARSATWWRGWTRGPRQAHAERIYRTAGYRAIANFNDNPVASFFGEKAL